MKRRNESSSGPKGNKKNKSWRAGRSQETDGSANFLGVTHKSIEIGDAGIWATCERGREGRCMTELVDLVEKCAEELYGDGIKQAKDAGDADAGANSDNAPAEGDGNGNDDIEAAIRREVAAMKHGSSGGGSGGMGSSSNLTSDRSGKPLVVGVRLDTPCVLFVKTRPPLDPAVIAHRICEQAQASHSSLHAHSLPQSRFIKRLTPASVVGKAYEKDLREVATRVLGPFFGDGDGDDVSGSGLADKKKKFAIRSSIRNHNDLSRDLVIRTVAATVGPGHSVDLKHYDLMILVEVYKNICSVAVVGSDYDSLKRYNVAEIYSDPNFRPSDGHADGDKSGPRGLGTRVIAKDREEKDSELKDNGRKGEPDESIQKRDEGEG